MKALISKLFGYRNNNIGADDPLSPHYDEHLMACTEKRRIFVNIPPGSRYLNRNKNPKTKYRPNKVSTSKYSFLNFLPKNIIEQFRGIANFYFLSLVILQGFPMFKTVDISVTALPIVIIFVATALKVRLYIYLGCV